MAENVIDTEAEATVRAEARAFLDASWKAGMPRKEWLPIAVDSGWSAPGFPTQWYGKGLAPELSRIVSAEFARAGAPGGGQDAYNLWANTVLAFGTDDLKQRFVRRLLLDDVAMCLLYSEPGAGSDLAGIQTTAARDGDEWVVNGQKVWTSGGREAEFGMLIARTDWDQPKHKGITFFWLPMRQPGVDVRPLRQMTGDARFNEVFITDARVPDANRVGDLNEGWRVLQTALAYERAVMGVAYSSDEGPGTARERVGRAPSPGGSIPIPDLSLVKVAQEQGRADDPIIRQKLVQLHAMRTVNNWNSKRAAAALEQGTSSPLVSLGKLAMSNILHFAGHLHCELLGAEATLAGPDSPRSADANYSHHNAFFTSIGGGTDQIQRNIIGERILGLPREPEPDKGQPFREVRRAQ